MNADHLYEGTGTEDGKCLILCTKETEWRMGNDGARDARMRIGCSIAAERRMDGIGAFVRRNLSGGWGVTDHLHKGDGVTDGR